MRMTAAQAGKVSKKKREIVKSFDGEVWLNKLTSVLQAVNTNSIVDWIWNYWCFRVAWNRWRAFRQHGNEF